MSKRFLLFLAFSALAIFSYATLMEFKVFNFSKNAIENGKPLKRRALEIIKECDGNSVKLSTTAAGPYQWQKDGADIVGETSNTLRPTVAGKYTLLVETETSNEIILKFETPIASFTKDNTGTNCGTELIAFTNNSTNAESYLWEFGDGEKSTEKDPSHRFNADLGIGIQEFTVKLTVTSKDCKTSTVTGLIKIKRLPNVSLSDVDVFNAFSNCHKNPSKTNPNYTIQLKNTSGSQANIVSYTIDWKDGTVQTGLTNLSFPITHTYTELGAFNMAITAFADNGCQNTVTYTIANQSNPAGGLGTLGSTTGLCAPDSIPFVISNWQNNSPGTVYILNYGDGNTETFSHPLNNTGEDFKVTHTYTTSSCPEKTFTAKLIVKNACDETPYTAGNIQINISPKADFVASANNICLGTSIKFTDKTKKGSYTNCVSTTVYSWEFGDGSTSDLESPSHTYANAGKYTVTLTTKNPCGETKKTDTICVNPKPTANFTLPTTTNCAPFKVKPTNTSSTPNCGDNTYKWTVTPISGTDCDVTTAQPTYLNGTSSTSENPEFNFDNPGKYKITLEASSGTSCTTTSLAQEIIVKAPPSAVINLPLTTICAGASISPTATIKNCYGTSAVTYQWEFVGAVTTSSSDVAPTNIVYNTKGPYTIRLKVTNECGESIWFTKAITVNEVPVVTAKSDIVVCNGGQVSIGNFSTTPVLSGVTYTWTNSNTVIGLRGSDTGNIANFPAVNNGTTPITATITVTPKAGNCNGVPKTFTITVNPGAQVANAGLDQNLCDVTTTALDGSLANQGGDWTIVSGTGISFTDKNDPKTTVAGLQAGQNYELKWTVQGYAPCPTSSDNVKISVSPLTIGGTTNGANSFCGAGAGSITLSGHVGNVLRWERSLDGVANWTSISNVTASLNYTGLGVGNYHYRAVVQSGKCTLAYSNITIIEVKSRPNPPAVTTNYTYCLNDVATQLTSTGTGLKWYKALPLNSTNLLNDAPTPTTNIATTLTYYVTQTVDGCESNSATITVKVNPSITNNTIGVAQAICKNSTPAVLRNSGSAINGGTGAYTYQWQSSTDGTDFTDIANATTLNYQPGVLTDHVWYRRVVTGGTCSSISNEIKITVQGTLDNIAVSANQTVCNGAIPAKLTGQVPMGGSGTFTYTWEKSVVSASSGFSGIPNANDADYQPLALTQTTYFRRLVSSGSCNAVSDAVTITVTPVVTLLPVQNLVLCNGSTQNEINFTTDVTSSNIAFSWVNNESGIGLATSGGGNLPSFTTSNILKKPLVAKLDYKATYTLDGVACDAPLKSFNLTVLPTVAVTSNLPDLTLCTGISTTVIPLSSDAEVFSGSSIKYRWTSSVAIGLADGEGAQIPSFTSVNPSNSAITSVITVTPLYTYGGKTCEGTPTTYKITVNPAPKVEFSLPNQTICSNTSSAEVILTSATANVNISWTAAPVAGITGLVTSGTDKIPTQTLVNTTNAPITITFNALAATTGAANCAGVATEYKITVNPIPVVSAATNVKTICSNEKVTVALNSNVNATVFSWTVSANANVNGAVNGSGAIIDQLLINTSTEAQEIVYTVTPAFENGNVICNGSTITIKVTVNPSPIVNFSGSDLEICSGSIVPAVTLSSATPNAQITWQVAAPAGISGLTTLNGTTEIPGQTLVNTSNVPLTVTYSAVAKTADANACEGLVAVYKVIVYPVAKVTNAVLSQNVCSGASSTTVVLVSNVAEATFSWTATASSANVSGFLASGTGNIPAQRIINTGADVHKITYQITTAAFGCLGVPTRYEIDIYPSPVFTSSLATLEICSGKQFTYVPTSSTANVNFRWTRAVVAGISNAASNVEGVDAAGAINEILINTTINAIDVTYEFEMSINGCSSGVKYPLVVKVNPPTTTKFGLSQINGCAPFNLLIKNLNSRTLPSTYTVDFGDGSPIAVYNDTQDILHTYENESKFVKLFYIVITTRNECGEAISTPFEIRVQPQGVYSKLVLNATQSFGCAPLSVDFTSTNQSTGANLFTWDFGDGSPVRQTKTVNEKLTHIYAAAGDYTVRLTATNGCSTVSTTEVITVYPEVRASFTISKLQECAEKEISFTNTSDAQFTSVWDFGDGTTSTAVNPKHIYLSPGIKTVTLKSTRIYPNGGSCTAITTRTIQILAAPVSTFTTNARALNCGPFKLQVNATGINLSNVTWNFGEPGADGNIIGGLTASYTYTKAGDYLVTATAYNAQGCISVSTQTIRVTESPIAAFSTAAQQFCGTSATVNFKNETTYGAADVLSYKWLVNNSVVGTSKDFNYAFEVPIGATLPYVFKVSLIATNMVGCATKMEKNIQFNPFPKAVFNVVQIKGCVPFKVEINNQSVYVDQYEWYLDGVLVSKLAIPNDIILTEFNKTYTLKLLVKNRYGCTESEQITQVSTHPYLKADFTLAQDLSCNGVLNLQVTNTSVGATTYTWDYGDGTPIYVGTNPAHSYGKPGVYNLKLVVSNGFCTDSYTKKVTVSNAPKAAFLSDVRNGCNQLTVKFRNTSANATEYLWDFGDGTFSKEENPEHHYIYSKTAYTVKLTVKNAVGCSDESVATNFINVLPPPEATILITPNKIIKVPEYSFTFKAVTTENIIAYKWDFGDGRTANKPELIHKYDRFGTYKIKLHLTNISNCTNIIEDEVTILDFPGYLFIPNAFEPENLNNDLKIFKVKGGGMATYSMKIFNKWGQLIWQTIALDDQGVPLEYWDGMDKGAFLPQGAYFWQAEATFINGGVWKGMKYGNKAETKTGVIHLIR